MDRPYTTTFVAFVALSALSNVLGFLVVPMGPVTLHLIQLPIVFAGLAAGSLAGGLVGLLGAFVMAFTLTKPNPYIVGGNALLVNTLLRVPSIQQNSLEIPRQIQR